MLWTAIVFAAVAAPEPDAGTTTPTCVRHKSGWVVQHSENFEVWSRLPEPEHQELTDYCESCRSRLQTAWLGEPERAWTPKCKIVLNPTLREYNRAIGHVNDVSAGCTTQQFDGGHVVARRIDLRQDASDWHDSTLPHELTHVVISAELGTDRLAPWADEGMAVLSEADRYQVRRRDALLRAERLGNVYTTRDLLDVTQPPPASHRDGFYGQSGSLVQFLVSHAGPEKFLEFLRTSAEQDQHTALREVYALQSPTALGDLWTKWTPPLPMDIAIETPPAKGAMLD